MMWAKHKQGFTIVELLIVVVVIAILAAITIVAYNGIQNQAKDSALQTTSAQAGKKILAYAPLNSDTYPDEASFRSQLSLPATDPETAVYDYYVSDDRRLFCISVANTAGGAVKAYAFTQAGKTVEGRCVKNLVVNPSFEVTTSGWATANAATLGAASSAAALVGTNGAPVSTSSTSDSGIGRPYTFEVGKTYTFSCLIQSKAATAYSYKTSAQGSGVPAAGTVTRTLAQDQQARITATWTTTATVSGMYYCLRSGGQSGAANYNVDGVMLTETDRPYVYGDGNRDNWSWAGSANASMSFGPSLPGN